MSDKVLNLIPKIDVPLLPKKNVFEIKNDELHERLGDIMRPVTAKVEAKKLLYGELVGMVKWCVKQGHGVDPPWMLRRFLGLSIGGWNGVWILLFFINLVWFPMSIKTAVGLFIFQVLFTIVFFFLTSKFEHNFANKCLICGTKENIIHDTHYNDNDKETGHKAGKCVTCSWVCARWDMWDKIRNDRWDDIRANSVDPQIPIWWAFKHKWLLIDYYSEDPLELTSHKYTRSDKKAPKDILPIQVMKQLYKEQIQVAETTKLVIEMMEGSK